MDPNSSLGKICLGENIVEISSDKVEGSGDWNSPEFQDTDNNGQKKETKAMIFHQMDTEEVSDRFVAPCFVNRLEAYDGEINLGVEENMISNEYAIKLCLEHEVKRGNKVVKKELVVSLRGESYFCEVHVVTSEEDDVEPGVILGRSFLLMTKAILISDFGTIGGQVNENALVDTGSDINNMPYRIYEQLGREDMKNVDREITMINHTQAEAMGILTNVLCQDSCVRLVASPILRKTFLDYLMGFVTKLPACMIRCYKENTERDSDDDE
ncbi:hypothetical protein Tco_0133477 [Tanacetum coccineum]